MAIRITPETVVGESSPSQKIPRIQSIDTEVLEGNTKEETGNTSRTNFNSHEPSHLEKSSPVQSSTCFEEDSPVSDVKDQPKGPQSPMPTTLPLPQNQPTTIPVVEHIPKEETPKPASSLESVADMQKPAFIETASCSEPSSEEEEGDKKEIALKNLPWELRFDEMQAALQTLSHQPTKVRFLRDPKGRFSGVVFVKYNTARQAQQILQELQGFTILDRAVAVELAKYKKKKGSKKKSALQPTSSQTSLPQLDEPETKPTIMSVMRAQSTSNLKDIKGATLSRTDSAPNLLPKKTILQQTTVLNNNLHPTTKTSFPNSMRHLFADRHSEEKVFEPSRLPISPPDLNSRGFDLSYRLSRRSFFGTQ